MEKCDLCLFEYPPHELKVIANPIGVGMVCACPLCRVGYPESLEEEPSDEEE